MSSAYSRNSWPYKKYSDFIFLEFLECWQGAEGSGKHGERWLEVGPRGRSGLSVKRRGWTEGSTVKGRLSLCWLQRQRAVFSGCWGFWSSQRSLQGPSSSPRCLPSWPAVEQNHRRISVSTAQRAKVPPQKCWKYHRVKQGGDGHFLTCNTVLSLKPKPSFSRQVMYVMSMQRKGLMARYLVILLHTADTDGKKCPKRGFWHTHRATVTRKAENTLSNECATWLEGDHSDWFCWVNREVWGEELRVSARLRVGGGGVK